MQLVTFSFSRFLSAGVFISLITMICAGCDKDDKPAPPTIPVVATASLTNISYNAATAGGSIVTDGGTTVTASGIVWSKTNAIPTLSDSMVAGTTATGTFSSNLTGLEENTSYFIRAFATNSVGTGYGNVVTLNTTNDTNKVRFTYNGEEVVYGIIVSPITGRRWLDRNLGAKQVATAVDDYLAYGDLFQWGRPADGHQLMNWTSSTMGTPVNETTTTVATSDVPGNSNFILAPYDYPFDWRSDNNRNRWATTAQGACPAGWHVPSNNECLAEFTICVNNGNGGCDPMPGTAPSGGIIDANTAFMKLKLTFAGTRELYDVNIVKLLQPGVKGMYWASTDSDNFDSESPEMSVADGFSFNGGVNATAGTEMGWKVHARAVRCIKD